MQQPNPAPPTIPSFQAYVDDRRYLKNVSAKTLEWYKDAWKAFGPHIEPILAVGAPLSGGLMTAIVALQNKKVRSVSINSYLTCVRAYVNWLHAEGFLKDKPRVQLLKYEHKVLATFSPAHVKALLAFKPKGTNECRTWPAVCVMLDAGPRLSEVLGLRKTDIDLDNLLLRLRGKGNKQRLVPMSLELRKILYRYLLKQKYDLVFGTRNGTRVTNRNFQRDFRAICQKLHITGVRCSPHTLRHTFAVSYLRNGGNLFYLSKILGHTSVKTTERYSQSLGVEDLQAVHNGLSLLSPK